jgi:hypothetical protein
MEVGTCGEVKIEVGKTLEVGCIVSVCVKVEVLSVLLATAVVELAEVDCTELGKVSGVSTRVVLVAGVERMLGLVITGVDWTKLDEVIDVGV